MENSMNQGWYIVGGDKLTSKQYLNSSNPELRTDQNVYGSQKQFSSPQGLSSETGNKMSEKAMIQQSLQNIKSHPQL